MSALKSEASHKFTVISTIISFFLISSALLSVADTPIMGYELSIYSATPKIFWVAIIFGLLNGLLLIALDLYRKTRKMWIVGLFQIILCNCLVISLYALRGNILYLGRSDILSHVGMVNDVIKFGYFDNIYPISSILISTLSQVMDVPVILISNYLPSLFFVIYMLSIYCWSKSLIYDRKFVLCSIMASAPIFFAWFITTIYPMLLSILTIPFFLYCLQRNTDYRFRFFSIILCIIYPIFHPITAVMVFLYLAITFICERYWLKLDEKRAQISTTLIISSFVTLIAWFTWQYMLLKSLKLVIYQFIGILEIPTTLNQVQYYISELGIWAALRSFLWMVADEIVFSLITFIAFFFILRDERFKKKFMPIAICYIIGSFFILACSIFTYAHTSRRFINLNPNMVLTPPLVGYSIYTFLIKNKRTKTFLVLSMIAFSATTAVFSLYPSPITMLPNNPLTISDVSGMKWLINRKNTELKTADIQSPVYSFADLIYGCNFRIRRSDLRPTQIPDHFGFTDKNFLPIEEDRYLVITEYDVRCYTEVWKDIDKFSEEDFIKIDFCNNVNKIYENGEFRSYFVYKDG